MKKQASKSISSLDLKLLDVKFIAIDDNQLYLTEVLQSVRKAKLTQLPSLLLSKNKLGDGRNDTILDDDFVLHDDNKNRSTVESVNQLDQSFLSNNFRSTEFSCLEEQPISKTVPKERSQFSRHSVQQSSKSEIESIKQSIKTRNLLKNRIAQNPNIINSSFSEGYSKPLSEEEGQLEKYRKKIDLIKKENILIHQQISSLYRNKINQNKESLKKIRKIEPFKAQKIDISAQISDVFCKARQNSSDPNSMKKSWQRKRIGNSILLSSKPFDQSSSQISKKLTSCPMIREKINFYENLTEKSPYKEELQNIHKKIISNNWHKNFEQYLVNSGKRIPDFIKKLRN